MTNKPVKFFLITGDPGVGKTTITKKIISSLQEKGIKTSGFYTEEVRNGRARVGFDVVSLDGQRGRLARDQSLTNTLIKPTVGKYGVLVKEFEKIGLAALNLEDQTSLLVIDEIGKMEFFSSPFKERIKQIFSENSNHMVLATIPIQKSDLIIEGIRQHRNGKLWTVTRENRNSLHEEIIKEIRDMYDKQTKVL